MRIPHGLRAALAGQGTPAPSTDANFENTVLLLHGDGTNGAQNNTFTDGSTNNFTITRSGNATQGTFSPYGDNWSNYFDGTGDYLTYSHGSELAFGTGDFTVEWWMCSNNTSIGILQGDANAGWGTAILSGQFYWQSVVNVTNKLTTSVSAYLNSAWNHWAIIRASGTLTLYINGTSIASVSDTTNYSDTAGTLTIGYYPANGTYLNGYISNLRIVKGTAVYTSNFTPSTTPLTAITNTSLLTCQSNRFIDNSTNNFTITRNGDVSVQRFSPFSPAAAYSSSTIGGSGYFDGNGDNVYCTPSNLTGQFTIEGWFYQTDNAGAKAFLGNWTTGCLLRTGSGTSFEWYMSGLSLSATIVSQKNQWCHAAITRDSGNTVRLFLNGTQVASGTGSNTITMTNFTVGSERSVSGDPYAGYISGFRILNGTALYTSTFTPPTTPPTAITNTNLLLNFTNGGIIDNTMMNDLETVGNAQISTSVKKYGTGSLAFDGTGDWLVVSNTSNSTDFAADFTIEMWVYATSVGSYRCIFTNGDAGSSSECGVWLQGSDVLFWDGNWNSVGFTISTNTWTHLAFARSGSTIRSFKDGVKGTDITKSGSLNRPYNWVIGSGWANSPASYPFTGYIDDFRITKGVARYTANFTPPTAALPDL